MDTSNSIYKSDMEMQPIFLQALIESFLQALIESFLQALIESLHDIIPGI